MTEQWCKIIEVEGRQVLFFVDYDEDDDLYQLHQMSRHNFGMSDIKSGFKEEAHAIAALESVNETTADRILNYVDDLMTD